MKEVGLQKEIVHSYNPKLKWENSVLEQTALLSGEGAKIVLAASGQNGVIARLFVGDQPVPNE